MSFNQHNLSKNACQLFGGQAHQGYDWWWHSFTARNAETGEEKPFFLEFYACNPLAKQDIYTMAHPVHLLNRAQEKNGRKGAYRPSYVMVKAGTWGRDAQQLHRFWAWKDAKVDMGVPFCIVAEDCFLSETESRGKVTVREDEAREHPEWMCGAGEMSWNLKIRKDIAFNVGYGTSALMRRLQAFEMFWHAEGMRTYYEGEVVWNGVRYVVSPENCYGYADKNWGKDFTTPWLWLSSCNLTSEITGKRLENSAFDIGGGRPKVWFVSLPGKLLSAFWYEGKPFEFNFSKLWTFTRTKFSCQETEDDIIWHVEQKSLSGRMVTDIRCRKADMLLVNYEAPNGLKRHNRLWNGGNGEGTVELYRRGKLVDRVHVANVGCEWGEYCEPEEKSWLDAANEKK